MGVRTGLLALMRVAIVLALPGTAFGQGCQLSSALVYGSYVDAAGSTQFLHLDLMRPTAASGQRPLVIWIHGGGWQGGSYTPIPSRVTALCSRGYAVASVQYRLSQVAKWPAQIQDVRGAIRWLRARASTYALDPGRFAVWGHSAGGHLAAFAATSGGHATVTVGSVTVNLEGSIGGNLSYSSRVQAAVNWYGITDFMHERFYPLTRDPDASSSYEGNLLGGSIQTYPELAATANPVAHASPDDPPVLVMHGTADDVVPLNQSELLVDALDARGTDVRFHILNGAAHASAVFDASSNLAIVYDFLAAALQSPDPPPPVTPLPSPVAGGLRLDAIDAIAAEPGDGGRFRVTRTGNVSSALQVWYTVGGTAAGGEDFRALPNVITIAAGALSATIDITPLDDDRREGTETVILSLTPSATYAIDKPWTASVALRDNDNSSTRPTVSVSGAVRNASEAGPSAGSFILSRTGSTASPLTVAIAADGTASHGVDYAPLPSTITFATGVSRVSVPVTPYRDAITEGPETVVISVTQDAAVYAGPYEEVITIADFVPAPAPPGWTSTDIGAVGAIGSASLTNGVYTVSGAGADIWGTSDAFQFLSQPLTGDGQIVARVASISGPEAWTKVGVMIRGTTSASSAHASMFVSAGKGTAFQRRLQNGGVSVHTTGNGATAPHWVKLTRQGNVIAGFISADGVTWTLVARDTVTLPSTALVGLAVSSHQSASLATATFDGVSIGAIGETLPSGWTSRDIGVVGMSGGASAAAGTFTVRGAGADIWGATDAFHFAHRTWSGDGEIVARVSALSGTQAWAKAGVMMRSSLDPAAPHAFMLVSLGKGAAFQRRTAQAGLSTSTTATAAAAPLWVRLVRAGNVITAFHSRDGATWTLAGQDTVTLPSSMLIGIAVTSHDATTLATATVADVTVGR